MDYLFESDEFYFTPLGGSEEFGCNLNFYICNGEGLIVDCGIGFADERFPGIDLLLPDPRFIEDHKDKISGLIITHAHEDHIGAVAYLWNRLECPIYASPFTAAILRKKFEEHGIKDAPVHVIQPDGQVKTGVFDVDFIPVSHSVPESCALHIRTPHGNVLHSGDWNLDPAPIIGRKTEEERFRSVGDNGVLAYVGDSTNAQVGGYSGSEQDVAKGLAKEFKTCHGKIAITIFASNIGRLVSIIRAAQEVGRSVAIIGRSLHRMVSAAHECGYLNDIPDFISEDDIEFVADENLVLVVTGSQGEHRAALARIARGEHRSVRLNRGDTVIFSSRAIPGNERHINNVKNNLSAGGIRIITPDDTPHKIHVSGHPCSDEITSMLQWVRPQCVVPVHGERVQLDAQANLAASCQVQHTVVPDNGSIIRLAPGSPEIIDHVETGMLAVDHKRIIPVTHQSITARRKLQYSGAVHVSLVLNHDLDILGEMKIDTVGLSCQRNDDCIRSDLEEFIDQTLDTLPHDIVLEEHELSEAVRIPLRRYVMDMLGLRPKTTVHVTLLNI